MVEDVSSQLLLCLPPGNKSINNPFPQTVLHFALSALASWHPGIALSKHSDLEADLLADALAVVVAAWVWQDRQALLLRHGPLPDVLQPSRAAQLLGQQGLELGALNGAQQDHWLWEERKTGRESGAGREEGNGRGVEWAERRRPRAHVTALQRARLGYITREQNAANAY